jgi:hypothetical protein
MPSSALTPTDTASWAEVHDCWICEPSLLTNQVVFSAKMTLQLPRVAAPRRALAEQVLSRSIQAALSKPRAAIGSA